MGDSIKGIFLSLNWEGANCLFTREEFEPNTIPHDSTSSRESKDYLNVLFKAFEYKNVHYHLFSKCF